MRALILVLLYAVGVCYGVLNGISEPIFTLRAEERARAVHRAEAYIASVTGAGNLTREGATPMYYFHDVGTRVHGTAVVFHGGAGRPSDMVLIAKYLFDNNFNVYLPALAGHALVTDQWPYGLLRDEKLRKKVRNALISDKRYERINAFAVKDMAKLISFEDTVDRPFVTTAFKILKERLSEEEYGVLTSAFDMLIGPKDLSKLYYNGVEKDIQKMFAFDGSRYMSNPEERLSDVASLPGPVFALGYSLGGVQAFYLASRAKHLKRIVTLAPGIRVKRTTLTDFIMLAGMLDIDLLPKDAPLFFPNRFSSAVQVLSRYAFNPDAAKAVRENTDTFCIIAADDSIVDVDAGLYICRDAVKNAGSTAFIYPKKLGINHGVGPPLSKYSDAMFEEIVRYFTTGKVQKKNMLNENSQ